MRAVHNSKRCFRSFKVSLFESRAPSEALGNEKTQIIMCIPINVSIRWHKMAIDRVIKWVCYSQSALNIIHTHNALHTYPVLQCNNSHALYSTSGITCTCRWGGSSIILQMEWKHLWCWCLGAARPNARVYLHVHSHHLYVITKVQRSVTMLNNAMGVTDDRSMKVGHYVAMLAVVSW